MLENNKNLVQRDVFLEIAKHLETKEITLIIGPRQVGKTTLISQLKDPLSQKGVAEGRIFSFNLDLVTDRKLFANQTEFIEFLKERIGQEKLFVLVDEAQRVGNAGIFFKGIYDLGLPVKFVLTGSSALEIKSKIHEPLTGRKRLFYLYPMSFEEYLSAKDSSLVDFLKVEKELARYTKERLFEHLYQFIVWGGYPKIALEGNRETKEQFLKEVYSSYIERDIIGFLEIKNTTAFTKLVAILASQIGQLVNTQELSSTLNVERKTVEKYLEVLEKTFIIEMVSPFFRNVRKELTKMPKVYFLDAGLRNFALGDLKGFEERHDKGAIVENFLFSELRKRTDAKFHFWRTKEKAEVDFVLEHRFGEPIPIEVKATRLKSPEISRSFRSFLNTYKPKRAFVVNLGFQGSRKIESTNVEFLLPYEISKVLLN
ncbi:MAG: ATP-binding protein [Patescibacteria group bacterium]